MNDGRLRILLVSEDAIVDFFRMAVLGGQEMPFITLPQLNDVPRSATLVSVHHDWQSKCWALTLRCLEWPVVPEGDLIPRLHVPFKTFQFEMLPRLTDSTYRPPVGPVKLSGSPWIHNDGPPAPSEGDALLSFFKGDSAP